MASQSGKSESAFKRFGFYTPTQERAGKANLNNLNKHKHTQLWIEKQMKIYR